MELPEGFYLNERDEAYRRSHSLTLQQMAWLLRQMQRENDTTRIRQEYPCSELENFDDINCHGDGDTWKLITQVCNETEGWYHTPRAYEISGVGCVVQSTVKQRNGDWSYSIAESLTFAPMVTIREYRDIHGNLTGRRLEPMDPVPQEWCDAYKRLLPMSPD